MSNITALIADMTSAEINAYIMGNAAPDKPVAMSSSVAMAIIEHPNYENLSPRLRDWAWNSVDVLEEISINDRPPKIVKTL